MTTSHSPQLRARTRALRPTLAAIAAAAVGVWPVVEGASVAATLTTQAAAGLMGLVTGVYVSVRCGIAPPPAAPPVGSP
jgi:membrane associated rhomboid family serine protease